MSTTPFTISPKRSAASSASRRALIGSLMITMSLQESSATSELYTQASDTEDLYDDRRKLRWRKIEPLNAARLTLVHAVSCEVLRCLGSDLILCRDERAAGRQRIYSRGI